MKKNKKALQKIDAIANKEFNYVGSGNSGEDQNYIGTPGEYDFGGKGGATFADEHGKGRSFSLRIVNGTTIDQVIAFNPASYDTLAELAAEGHSDITAILADGVIDNTGVGEDCTVTSLKAGKTVTQLLRWLKQNNSRIVGMTWQTTTRNQFDTIMSYENINPFFKDKQHEILITKYAPASQLGTDKADIDLLANDEVIDMNDQNLVRLTVLEGCTLTINLYFGAVDNRAAKLNAKASQAHSNMRRKFPQHYK